MLPLRQTDRKFKAAEKAASGVSHGGSVSKASRLGDDALAEAAAAKKRKKRA